MTEEELWRLIEEIRQRLNEAGLSEIGALENYLEETSDGGPHLPSPHDLAIEMLEAFDRHLALLDHRTYENAMERIRGQTGIGDESPVSAMIHPLAGEYGGEVLSLEQLVSYPSSSSTSIADIRCLLSELITSLRGLGPGEMLWT